MTVIDGMTEFEVRMARVRASVYTIQELCAVEDRAIAEREWWLAEQIRRAVAHKCIEGGGESGKDSVN